MNKENIGSLFDRIAASYDWLNHLFSLNIDRLWRKKAVKTMSHHDKVLDVAIGTADFAIEMLRLKKADLIQGIDLSDEMMVVGKRKVEREMRKYPQERLHVNFLNANAQLMPFDDESFGAVTCSFGCRNFQNLDAGLKEMYRVMKKGGELVILEFSYPGNPFIRACYDFYFSRIVPTVGRWLSRDKTAYTYLNRSVKNFIWGEEMTRHIIQAGFVEASFRPLTFGIATLYKARKI